MTWCDNCFSEMPEADMKGIYHGTLTVKAGEPIQISIPITGKPPPSVTWTAAGEQLEGKFKTPKLN